MVCLRGAAVGPLALGSTDVGEPYIGQEEKQSYARTSQCII